MDEQLDHVRDVATQIAGFLDVSQELVWINAETVRIGDWLTISMPVFLAERLLHLAQEKST